MERESILIQENRNGKIKFIKLELIGDTLYRTWGLLEGKEQETSHTYDYINEGKSNELDPEKSAEMDFNRKRERKIKEGYTEVPSLEGDPEELMAAAELDSIDFSNPPTSFAPSKPHKDPTNQKLMELVTRPGVVQHKENGMCHFIFVDEDAQVRIFTRRMDDHTRKYPDMQAAVLRGVEEHTIPLKSVLAVEFTVDQPTHMAGFKRMQKISKSDTNKGTLLPSQEKALALQKETPVRGCVFHIPYWDGEELWKSDYVTVWEKITEIFCDKSVGTAFYHPVEVSHKEILQSFEWKYDEDGNLNDEHLTDNIAQYLRQYVIDRDITLEGLVLWADEPINIDFNGKPKRRACWKLLIPKETDVVATGWMEGKGDHQGMIGALYIGKYREDGSFLEMGRVGSGIKDTEMDPKDWEFPCVVQIQYGNQYSNGKFQFPRFIKVHEDKRPEECIVDPETGI